MKRLSILVLPFVLNIIFSLSSPPPWFTLVSREILIPLAIFFLLITIYLFTSHAKMESLSKSIQSVMNEYRVYIFLAFFLFMLFFPIRNLNWGDGIILLETNDLETKLFGAQTAMDEILETIFHSLVFRTLIFFKFGDDNRLSYQIVSTLAGLILLTFLGWKLGENKKEKAHTLGTFLFLSSSGFLVFFGYAENYSLVSLVIFFAIYYSRKWIIEERSANFLLFGATSMVVLGIFFHLVAGYLVFLLGYLWWEFSPKKKKLFHLISLCLYGCLLIGLGFSYFLFINDPMIDRHSTHILHPPFYPWKRLLSLNHFKEILSVLWWNSNLSSAIILFSYLFYKKEFLHFFIKPENRVLAAAFFSFLINGFIFNPMLGFPADWDLMGFYWIPLSFIGYFIFCEIPAIRAYFLPLITFSLALQIFHAIELSKTNPEKEAQLQLTHRLINIYVNENREYIESLPKSDKKFYARTDFFFFKASSITKSLCSFTEQRDMLAELESMRNRWHLGMKKNQLNSQPWIKDFLTSATGTNTRYVRFLEVNKICHPEL